MDNYVVVYYRGLSVKNQEVMAFSEENHLVLGCRSVVCFEL